MLGIRTNTERVAKAERVLREYHLNDDPFSAVVDLLADIRHFCDARKIGFADQDRLAHDHYLYELHSRRQARH